MSIAIALHVLSAVVWVGGMFFAYLVLRPVAARTLEPPVRLLLWRDSFNRFFPWVWASVIVLLISGYWMIFAYFGGMGKVGIYVHIMQGLGLLMMLLYLHVYFSPFRRLKQALAVSDYATAGKRLNQIRILIGINLILGILVVLDATAGKYL